ncbi:MAG TPA: hypothetical protein VND65_22250 [Candidatus Binatia bacterium]|nr:hypothetical protein [Candidatus Binatia bacterium]
MTDLATASEQLAVAAQTIRNMHPAWGEAVVNLIIAVNAVVVRIQNKGAEAYARYLEKHGATGRPSSPPEAGTSDQVAGERSMPLNEEES